MNRNIGITALVGIVVGVVYFAFTQNKTDKVCAEEICKVDSLVGLMDERDESLVVDTVDVTAVKESGEVSVESGSFVTYSAEKVATATGDVVIFFHAAWCPSCKALSNDIEKNVRLIPSGMIILKADYDTEVELKKKYGVTTQHTLVQVDRDGNFIKKWSGGTKLTNLFLEIK